MARTRRADTNAPGIRRVGRGPGFSYHEEDGRDRITDKATLDRIRSLAIPPAWTDVWICPHPRGHIQATGLRRRRAQAVPLPRRLAREPRPDQVRRDGGVRQGAAGPAESTRRGRCASATSSTSGSARCAVRLLDLGLFRIGSERYETDNESYGLATIKRTPRDDQRSEAIFDYPSKSGQRSTHRISDAVVMPTLQGAEAAHGRRRAEGLPRLRDGDGVARPRSPTTSTRSSRSERATASAPRTSGPGTRRCWRRSASPGRTSARRRRRRRASASSTAAVERTATYLNNTPAVCRSSYIDPRVFDRSTSGETIASRLKRIERRTDAGEFAGPRAGSRRRCSTCSAEPARAAFSAIRSAMRSQSSLREVVAHAVDQLEPGARDRRRRPPRRRASGHQLVVACRG